MAKTEKSSDKQEDIKVAYVFYTDGGCRPTNPGFGGYGFHGYVYSNLEPKKGIGLPTEVTTNEGYKSKSDPQLDEFKIVKPLEYINGFGTISGLVTNNVAEITAATYALEYAKTTGVKDVTIITDSKGVVEASNQWIQKWSQNNWTKSDGNPVANQEYWQLLDDVTQTLRADGVDVKFKWIKGHNGHVGNEMADKLATIGVFKNQSGTQHHSVSTFPADGYWTATVEKHPLTAHKRLFMVTDKDTVKEGQYYFADGCGDDDLHGLRHPEHSYSYVELDQPDETIEMIRLKQLENSLGRFSLLMFRMDKIHDKQTHTDLIRYGVDCLSQPNKDRLDLVHVDRDPLVLEKKPAYIAWRAIDYFAELKGIYEAFKKGDASIQKTDITDMFFETNKKGECKLKSSIDSTCEFVQPQVTYGSEGKTLDVKVTLGIDITERNSLKKLEKLNPKVYMLTWTEGDNAFRYASVIETSTGRCIQAGVYSNLRLIADKQT